MTAEHGNASTDGESAQETIALWHGDVPEGKGVGPEHDPYLAVQRPDAAKANGAAVIVCPGGGYNILSHDHEGRQVANWLNAKGVTAFVLAYRLKTNGYPPEVALLDGKRAVRLVRSRAAEYGIDPVRIGMMGFSAGGHLSLQVALHSDTGDSENPDPIERVSCRPDRLFPIYTPPAYPEEMTDQQRDRLRARAAQMPPTFLMLATQDAQRGWADGIMLLYQEILGAGGEAELHQFGNYGPHGVGLADGHPSLGLWPELAFRWMREGGFLVAKDRVGLKGVVHVDDRPLRWGWIILTSLESEHYPVVSHMISNKEGNFDIPPQHGPVPGRYRLEIIQNAIDFKRNEPSMAKALRYAADRPGGKAMELVVETEMKDVEIHIRTI